MEIRRTPELIRRAVPFARMARAMRWVFIFCLGFYCGRAADFAPAAVEALIARL